MAIGLKKKYKKSIEFRIWFRQLYCLALTPVDMIKIQWEFLKLSMVQNVKPIIGKVLSEKYLKYFEKTYMGSLFLVDTWNHFSNPDDRTNNRVESYNLKMRKFILYVVSQCVYMKYPNKDHFPLLNFIY